MSSAKPGPGKGPVAVTTGDGKSYSGQGSGTQDALNDLESGLEATVAAYLRRQPDFFARNPDLLGNLHIPHASGGAVSLIEHQVSVLRRQLETEKGRLSHLITRAREYESLSNRLHGLVLQIIPARGLDGLCRAMQDALTRELSAQAVTLKLFPLDPASAGDSDPTVLAFRDFLDNEHALCGPLEAEKNTLLFGEAGDSVRSAAIMPIRAGERSGVLAIGAADPDRFRPDMGTDLLDRLAEIVSCKLVSLPPGDLVDPSAGAESAAEATCAPATVTSEDPPEIQPGI